MEALRISVSFRGGGAIFHMLVEHAVFCGGLGHKWGTPKRGNPTAIDPISQLNPPPLT